MSYVNFQMQLCVPIKIYVIQEVDESLHLHKNPSEPCRNTLITNHDTHVCDKCEKTFDSEKNLKKHLKNHTRKKSHECVKCNKVFFTSTVCPFMQRNFIHSSAMAAIRILILRIIAVMIKNVLGV